MEGIICSVDSDFIEPIFGFKVLKSYGQSVGSSVNQPGVCTFQCNAELNSSQEYFVITDGVKHFVTINNKLLGNIEAFITRKPVPIAVS